MAEDGSRRRLSPAGMIGGLIALVVLVPRRTSGMPIPLLRSESDLIYMACVKPLARDAGARRPEPSRTAGVDGSGVRPRAGAG